MVWRRAIISGIIQRSRLLVPNAVAPADYIYTVHCQSYSTMLISLEEMEASVWVRSLLVLFMQQPRVVTSHSHSPPAHPPICTTVSPLSLLHRDALQTPGWDSFSGVKQTSIP